MTYREMKKVATVIVNVFNVTAPLLTGLKDLEFEVGTTCNFLIISATDLNPDSYAVYLNSILNQTRT